MILQHNVYMDAAEFTGNPPHSIPYPYLVDLQLGHPGTTATPVIRWSPLA